MATSKKTTRQKCGPIANSAARKGKLLLNTLASSLQDRGVPLTSYVMVNLASGEFVTGKTWEEAYKRFELMHAGEEGWIQLLGDVVGKRDNF